MAAIPGGQVPILEVNGVVLQQSVTIAHYAARRAGLCGSNDLEAAQAEMVAQILHENVNRREIVIDYISQ